jgi:hypothetical protein
VAYEPLDAEALEFGDLSRFDTIVVDLRAYLVRPDLVAHNGRLLEWVRRGGHLIVMYQKVFEWRPEFAPYPLVIGRERVTQEEAPVVVLEPNHPLFTFPNAIGPQDWEGWVQERGLYFAHEWSSEYVPLLASHDAGEPSLRGGHLFARYGKGSYLYTGYVWYRQLRAGVPGAFRLLANMLSYPRRPREGSP